MVETGGRLIKVLDDPVLKSERTFPGSDRLDGGMAGGEIPPPVKIAAAANQGSLRPRVAVLYLAGVLSGLALIVALSQRTQLVNNVPLDKPPEFLVGRAREIIRNLGYADPPLDSWHGFVSDDSWVKYVKEHDTTTARWEPMKTGERPVVGFVYRQSPGYLVSLNQYGVSFDDPPEAVSGMAAMILDGEGHLLHFVGVPPQIEEPKKLPLEPPGWSTLFTEAGLNRAEFHAVEPIRNPPNYGGVRAAWEGVIPGKNKIPVRIEAAVDQAKPVFFEIIHADDACYTQVKSQLPVHQRLRVIALVGSFGVTLCTGIFLAYSSLKRGRSDHKGAYRLALFVFLATILRCILFNHHIGSIEEFRILAEDLSVGISLAACLWLAYVVVEPIVRARFPQLVTSWSRLLAGDFRDTLVGRDLLIGCLFGVLFTITQCVWNLAPAWLGWPPAFPSGGLGSIANLAFPAERVLLACDKALLLGIGLSFMIALLSRLLRKDWLGATTGWIVLTAAFLLSSHETVIDFFFAGVSAAVLTFCLMRFGLLSAIFLCFAYRITYKELSITSHFRAWYARGTILALVVLVGLAICGFWTSLGGQSRDETR